MFDADSQDDAYHGILPGTTGAVDADSAFPVAGDTGLASGTGTGQYGINPDLGGTSMGDAISSVWDWLNKPFRTPMSPIDIGLLIGVIIIAILVWNLLLYHIRIAAEAL